MRHVSMMLLLLLCAAAARSQEINLSVKNASLESVFSQLEKQSGYTFFYKVELIRTLPAVTVDVRHATIQQALDQCLAHEPLSYSIIQKTVVIKPKAEPAQPTGATAPPNGVVVHGKVVDKDGLPLPGVSISLKGTPNGWTSNVDGQFTCVILEGEKSRTLVFTSVSYTPREISVKGTELTLIVSMRPQISTLDEIQTTAYSKTTKRYNTGDITTITSDEIARNPVPNVLQAIQGRVPGLFITQQTGAANGASTAQIRSLNTLSGNIDGGQNGKTVYNAQPLYIVDGVEYPAGSTLPMLTGLGPTQTLDYGSALNFIDMSLIASIDVLKGADATSIYGSRGAFGVILITTKKAKAGKPSLSVNVYHGITELGTSPKLMNTQQYLAVRHNAFANDGLTPGAADVDVNGTWDTTKSTNWEKFFLGSHAPTTHFSATYMGGGPTSSFLINATYADQGNVQRSKGSVRMGGLNFSMNTGTVDHKLTFALSGTYNTNLDDMVPIDFTGTSGIAVAPDAPSLYLPNGQLNWSTGSNPAAVFNSIYKNTTDNLIANANLSYTPIRGLTLSAVGGYNFLWAKEFLGSPSTMFNPATFNASYTSSNLNQYSIRTLSADPRAEFNHTWGKSRLDVIAGGSIRDIVRTTTYIGGSGFLSDQILLDPATADPANQSTMYDVTPNRYIGAFATINYRWDDKYIVDLNGRRDGSSVFGNDRQFGNFGSVAGAWIVSGEKWFKPLLSFIDFLKIKGSYGLVGGNNVGPYAYLSAYKVFTNTYENQLSLTPQNLSNPYLHWETDKNSELGLNFDLLNGAVNVDATYYYDVVGDQIINQGLASVTGFTGFAVNSPAIIHTNGLEFMVVTHNIRKKNFTWDTRLNLTIPHTKLIAFPGLGNLVNNIDYQIGKPVTGIRLFQYNGVDPQKGSYSFINAAGVKGEFTPFLSPTQLDPIKDRTQFIDLAPKFYGGIVNSFTYKNFSMDFLVQVIDQEGPNYMGAQNLPIGFVNTNTAWDIASKRWMKPGDHTDVPKATTSALGFLDQINFKGSTGAYSNATYARLQNLSVSYRLPSGAARRVGAAALSVYVAGQNLLTVSRYGDLDPENMSAGHMPPLRVFTGGLNVTF